MISTTNITLHALSDGDDDDAPGRGLSEQLKDVGAVRWNVSGTVWNIFMGHLIFIEIWAQSQRSRFSSSHPGFESHLNISESFSKDFFSIVLWDKQSIGLASRQPRNKFLLMKLFS